MKIIHVKVLKNEELAKGKEHAFYLGLVVVGLTVSPRLLCLVGKSTGQLRVDSGSDLALGLLTLKKPGSPWGPGSCQSSSSLGKGGVRRMAGARGHGREAPASQVAARAHTSAHDVFYLRNLWTRYFCPRMLGEAGEQPDGVLGWAVLRLLS